MNENTEPKRLTVWLPPDTKLHSQYGFITYLDWCRRECERIGRSELAFNHAGEVAVRAI